MPPRRRKTERDKEIERLKKLAKTMGVDFQSLVEAVPLTQIGAEAQVRFTIEAESVLFYIETQGKGFEQKTCKHCQGLFLHTYSAVAYCSDDCRAFALAEHSIIWNFDHKRDSERWNAKGKRYVPKIIGVEATQALIDSGNFVGEVPEQKENEDFIEDEDPDFTPIYDPPGKGPVDEHELAEQRALRIQELESRGEI